MGMTELELKSQLEATIAKRLDIQNKIKTLNVEKEMADDKISRLLKISGLKRYTMTLDEKEINVEINIKTINRLQRKKLAEFLNVEPKQLKTAFFITKAYEGELTTDTYEACHLSDTQEEIKIKIKKAKIKK